MPQVFVDIVETKEGTYASWGRWFAQPGTSSQPGMVDEEAKVTVIGTVLIQGHSDPRNQQVHRREQGHVLPLS